MITVTPRDLIPQAVLKYMTTMTPITMPAFSISLTVADKTRVTGVTKMADRARKLQVRLRSEPVKTVTE